MKTTLHHCSTAPITEFSFLRAKDMMQSELVVVHASDPLREVERMLVDAQVSAVPVLDDDEHLLGIVSMRDVVSRYADDHELPADLAEAVLEDAPGPGLALEIVLDDEARLGSGEILRLHGAAPGEEEKGKQDEGREGSNEAHRGSPRGRRRRSAGGDRAGRPPSGGSATSVGSLRA